MGPIIKQTLLCELCLVKMSTSRLSTIIYRVQLRNVTNFSFVVAMEFTFIGPRCCCQIFAKCRLYLENGVSSNRIAVTLFLNS